MIRLVGLCGYAGAGKDTAALGLVREGATRVAFADPLKEMLATLMRIRGAKEEHINAALWGVLKHVPSPYLSNQTPRHAAQTLGTEWGRVDMDPDFWLDTFEDVASQHSDVVVTDVRFPNEVERIHDLGGIVIRIERPNNPGDIGQSHASEAFIADLKVDWTVFNDGSVEQLHSKVKCIVETVFNETSVA
jgi:hypothetical protein